MRRPESLLIFYPVFLVFPALSDPRTFSFPVFWPFQPLQSLLQAFIEHPSSAATQQSVRRRNRKPHPATAWSTASETAHQTASSIRLFRHIGTKGIALGIPFLRVCGGIHNQTEGAGERRDRLAFAGPRMPGHTRRPATGISGPSGACFRRTTYALAYARLTTPGLHGKLGSIPCGRQGHGMQVRCLDMLRLMPFVSVSIPP